MIDEHGYKQEEPSPLHMNRYALIKSTVEKHYPMIWLVLDTQTCEVSNSYGDYGFARGVVETKNFRYAERMKNSGRS